LVDKPWALIDDSGEVQKLIFTKDNRLILSRNGVVSTGSWEYFPAAKVLLIDRVTDKILLKEQYIDENVMLLKRDGTQDDYYALANEMTIPDYNIPLYLNDLRCKEFQIKEVEILGGKTIQIYDSKHLDLDYDHIYFVGKKILEIDNTLNPCNLADGYYVSLNKRNTIYVENSHITKKTDNLTLALQNGGEFQIEAASGHSKKTHLNKIVRINGKEIDDSRLTDLNNYIYVIQKSRISKILLLVEYTLKNGSTIKVEQENQNKITSGDIIVDSKPVFPLPDGTYKIKGKWRKIMVKNNVVQ
jgi:hypothetical protein